jgi:hypothetical protein
MAMSRLSAMSAMWTWRQIVTQLQGLDGGACGTGFGRIADTHQKSRAPAHGAT